MKIIIIGNKKDIIISFIIKLIIISIMFYCSYKIFYFLDNDYFHKSVDHRNAKYVTALQSVK